MKKYFSVPAAMRIAVAQLLLLCLSIVHTVEAQNLIFAKSFSNSTSVGGNMEGRGIAVDGSGNRYVVGSFQNAADFDPGAGTQNLISAGANDIFLAKYDASGNYVWARNMGGAGNEAAYAVALDASGNIYITGYFFGTADFDPGLGTQNLTTSGGNDIFLAKYDASGNYVWAYNIGGASADLGSALALDASGNIFITGNFYSTCDFDPGAGTQNLTSNGSNDIFLAKYDASGNYVWAISMGAAGSDISYALALDALGNSYITGYFNGDVDFDPGAGTQNLIATTTDIFMAKYDAAGNYISAISMSGSSTAAGCGLAVDASGNSYITGYFSGTTDFDPGAGTQYMTSSSDDIFLAKYDASGNYVWAKQMGGANSDLPYAMTLDALGNSYITGYFSATADFDPGAGLQTLTSAGNNDVFVAKYDASGSYVWAQRMGGTSLDIGYALAVDASGNSYSTGSFIGTADFDPGAGTVTLTAGGAFANAYISQLNSAGNYVSANGLGGYNNIALSDQGNAIRVDASGNTYITGFFNGTVDFDPGAGTQYLTSAGGTDIFLAKYDASGNYVWARNMGGAGNDVGQALFIDASGNSYITGNFIGTADFDPGAGTQTLSSAGGSDIFLAKYDASGNYVWAQRMGGPNSDGGNALAVDGAGNSYISGYFVSTADFDPGAGTQYLISAGSNDIFLAKYDASGNYVWAKRIGGGNTDGGNALAVDGSGNSYITGYFSGTADFDPGAGTQNLTSGGGNDVFLAKYNSTGNYVWAKRIGAAGSDIGYGVAIDASGNSYMTGFFTGTVDFDPGAGIQNLIAAGSNDVFLAKYDASGNYVWAKNMGGTGAEIGYSVAVDASGNSYTTGYFNGTADFDAGAGTQNLTSAGSNDIFLAKYDASGNYVWAKGMGGTSADIGYGVAVDASGNSFITGYFAITADFNPGTGTHNLVSYNSYDIFLAQYGPGTPLPISLETFTGRLTDNGTAVWLQWTTATEEDFAYFEIERSAGGSNSTTVGRVPGCGTCDARQQYSFTDHQPLTGRSSYRLRMVDKDGKAEYSKWLSFRINDNDGTLVLSPTITSGRAVANYELAGTARKIRISIFDVRGNLVQQKNDALANGSNQLHLDLSAQAPGPYYVQLAEQNGRVLATGIVIRQ